MGRDKSRPYRGKRHRARQPVGVRVQLPPDKAVGANLVFAQASEDRLGQGEHQVRPYGSAKIVPHLNLDSNFLLR